MTTDQPRIVAVPNVADPAAGPTPAELATGTPIDALAAVLGIAAEHAAALTATARDLATLTSAPPDTILEAFGNQVTAPYYADDKVTLYLGDCREVTEWLSADVLVTDPPYGMGYESNKNRDRRNVKKGVPIAGDDSPEARDGVLAAWGDKPALMFGTWRVPRPVATKALLIWHKVGAGGLGDLSVPWLPTHEEVYVLGSGFTGRRSDAVLSVPPLMSGDARRPDHPTPKPVSLMEMLIVKCPPGVIADPFAGSGSTLVAARNLGRRAIGVELDERYCETIAKRLAQDCLDLASLA